MVNSFSSDVKSNNNSPISWIKDAWILAKPYWQSNEKYKSGFLLALVIICNLLAIGAQVMVNKWYNSFYNILQTYDKDALWESIARFCIIASFYVLFSVISAYILKFVTIRWRIWLTKYYMDNWFKYKAYYKTRFLNTISDNPDQRISEDINSFIVLFLQLTLGFISAIVTFISFIGILWGLSGTINLSFNGYSINMPGYMVWLAIIYAVVGTYIMFKLGKPLIKLDFNQQKYEANFRYSLIRVRENAEPIAFYNGEIEESKNLVNKFTNVVNNFYQIISRELRLNIFSSSYGQISIIFPLIINTPRYFAKSLKLGDLMQITSAFSKVENALSFFIGAYSAISGGRAVMDRLYGFQQTIYETDNLSRLPIILNNNKPHLELNQLTINLPNQKTLIKNISLSLNSGDRLLIKGRSGSGKTTILRTLAGLWSYAKGNINMKLGLNILFIPQKPYLPIGKLKDAICYPKIDNIPNNEQIIHFLKSCESDNLIPALEHENNWMDILSLGEQQKLTFCRILINNPDIICLDEATSAIDEETEAKLYEILVTNLPNSIIISVGHRSTIKKWHNHELNVNLSGSN